MKLKDLIKQSGGSGSDMWNAPIELLDENPANIRLDTPELRAHIDGLTESIITHGFLRNRPLTVRQSDNDRLIVVDGNCRLSAVRQAIAKGAEIKTLPVLSEAPHTNEATRTLNMLLANAGKAHTPAEYATAITKLLSYGWAEADIASKLGQSRKWLTATMETAALSPDAQALIAQGKASAPAVRKAVRTEGEAGVARIAKAAAERGGKRVTARDVAPARVVAPRLSPEQKVIQRFFINWNHWRNYAGKNVPIPQQVTDSLAELDALLPHEHAAAAE